MAAVVANSDIRANFTATYQSTGSISNYMAALQTQVRNTFLAKEAALSAQLAAQGLLQSGAAISRSMSDNFLPMVDSFINSSLTYIQNIQTNSPIDSKAIANLFSSYSIKDVEYSRTYYAGLNRLLSASALDQILLDLKSKIELKYAVPIARFQ